MKHMKKMLSMCIALAMVITSLVFAVPANAWEAHTNTVDLRVGLLNDSHITASGGDPVTKATQAVSALKTLGGDKLDGLLLVGDVIYYPSENSDPTDPTPYNLLYDAITAGGLTKEDVFAYAMGNHEFPQNNNTDAVSAAAIQTFETQTGFSMNHVAEKNGFTFIVGGADNYSGTYSNDTQTWMMNEIDKAIAKDATNDVDGKFDAGVIPDSKKPVFVVMHHPVDGTLFANSSNKYNDTFEAFLKTRPQVVNITAHWHAPAQLPDNMWQDGYTAFQAPLVGGGYLEEVGAISTGSKSGFSQGSMMEIKDNVVSFYKMDYMTGEYIGEPWIVDVPAIVADRLDADSTNDKAHMLYSADKYENLNAPAFPDGAEVTLQVAGDTVSVTYPNNATMTATPGKALQDDFVRAHKIEFVANGRVMKEAIYMTDFYKAESARAESFTRVLSGLNPGTQYTANVYPMSPAKALGEPISATFETEALSFSNRAVRYEFEEGCTKNSSIIKNTSYASGGKILYSAYQNDFVSGALIYPTEHRGDGVQETYTDSFTVTVPYTGSYDVYAAISDYGGNWVSKAEVLIDEDVVIDGDGTVHTSLSHGGAYPSGNTPLALFQNSYEMEAGKEYTVTLRVTEPAANTFKNAEGKFNDQPFLFCADYIEFVPKMLILDTKSTERMEVENYADEFSIKPNSVKTSANCSKGTYVHWDTNPDTNLAPAILEIPVQVDVAGPYKVEYMASNVGSAVNVYLDGTVIDGTTQTISTESKPAGASNYPYFNEYHHAGNKYAFEANFPAGAHTLKIELTNRHDGANDDVAICLDYFDFTYNGVMIGDGKPYKFGFYENIAKFDHTPSSWTMPSSYTGKLAYMGGGDFDVTFTLPVIVNDTGLYDFVFDGAYTPTLSRVEIKDGDKVICALSGNNNYIDMSGDEKLYNGDTVWSAKRYEFSAMLTEGSHDIKVVAYSRGGVAGVAFAWDCMSMEYHKDVISKDTATRLEMEDYAAYANIPLNNGGTYAANVWNGAGCSEKKYFAVDTTDGTIDSGYVYSFAIPVQIEEAGLYDFEYVGNDGTSQAHFYIDSVDNPSIVASASETIVDDTKVDDTIQYFSSGWAIAKKYTTKVVLPEGNHNIIVTLKDRGNQDIARYLDYIQFTPVVFDVQAEGNSVAEFEDYSSNATVKTGVAFASGNELLFHSSAKTKPVIQFMVEVAESGYYDVEYVISNNAKTTSDEANASINHLSRIRLSMDGVEFGDSQTSPYAENYGPDKTMWHYFPLCRYETVLYLEKGTHSFVADVGITTDLQYKYQLDYIAFKPQDTLTVEDGVATAKVTFDDAVSGKAILALYNGKEMVSVNSVDVAEKETVNVTAPASGAFTNAKVFIWGDLINVVPLKEEVELSISK